MDLVYLYNSDNSNYFTSYIPGKTFTCHRGNIFFPDNLNYGDALISSKDFKFFVLRPSLIEYSMKVKRKNTIIYPKEGSRIILELSICSGQQVIEIGTGSGAFTYLLSRFVGSEGMVYNYDINQEFQGNAKKNIEKYGEFNNIVYHIQDTSQIPLIEKNVDAVFVDIPEPWTVVDQVYDSLLPGSRAGFLSPNIEQVQKTIEKMFEKGFRYIKTIELFERYIRVKKNMTRPVDKMIGHTAYLYFGSKITGKEIQTPKKEVK